ncbi:MAG: dTMP kinase [Capsulimonadaceae bacterium]|nr:dTMP kinase [Capsulimonadaceae bacterium]
MAYPIRFITFEGPEGAGKSTQCARLAEWLRARGDDVLTTRQPGGDPVGKRLREILLGGADGDVTDRAELLMMMADRSQSVAKIIRPHLAKGGTVLCDRYADSSLAYQGYGRGIDLEFVSTLNEFAVEGLWPDLTLLLDIDPAEGLARQMARTRMEEEAIDFHRRVHAGFLAIARQNPDRVAVIDADGSLEEVAERIRIAYEAHHRNHASA